MTDFNVRTFPEYELNTTIPRELISDKIAIPFLECGLSRFNRDIGQLARRSIDLHIYSLEFPKICYPKTFPSYSSESNNAYFYFAVRFLPQPLINKIIDFIRVVSEDASKYIQTQVDQTFIIIHRNGTSVPQHAHGINLTETQYVFTYGIQLTGDATCSVNFKIGDTSVPMFKESSINRISFDPSSAHSVELSNQDKGSYMWVIFDGITEFTDPSFIPEKNTINFWNLGYHE